MSELLISVNITTSSHLYPQRVQSTYPEYRAAPSKDQLIPMNQHYCPRTVVNIKLSLWLINLPQEVPVEAFSAACGTRWPDTRQPSLAATKWVRRMLPRSRFITSSRCLRKPASVVVISERFNSRSLASIRSISTRISSRRPKLSFRAKSRRCKFSVKSRNNQIYADSVTERRHFTSTSRRILSGGYLNASWPNSCKTWKQIWRQRQTTWSI